MAKLLSRINHSRIVLIFAVLFFVVYSYVSLSTPAKFVSPDEVTNHFFIDLYSRTGELNYSDELNEIADGIIRPRHTNYVDGVIIPENFLGFKVVSGTVAVVLPGAVRFITPLLAVLGAVFLYLLVRDIFDRRVALLSFLLLLVLPPYWYWSSLAVFENVAGCAMLIISVRHFFRMLNTNEPQHYFLCGLFLGLAIFIRAEYLLFGIPLVVIFLWNIRRIRIPYAGLTVVGLLASLGPFLLLNRALYGDFLITGQHVRWGWTISRQLPTILRLLAAPLGLLAVLYVLRNRIRWQYLAPVIIGGAAVFLHFFAGGSNRLDNLIENSLNVIVLTPLLVSLGLLGVLYCLKRGHNLQYMAFVAMCLSVLALYLLTGRVLATDVHSSYVRYLLPVYVLSLPFVSYLILSVRPRLVTVVLVLALLGTGVHMVHPTIQANIESCNRYGGISGQVVRATEPDAVIFVEYWDKVIFPDRRVGLVRDLPTKNREERLSAILMSLADRDVPAYMYVERFFRRLVDDSAVMEELAAAGYVVSQTHVSNLYSVARDPVLRVTDFGRDDVVSEVGDLRDGSLHSTGRPGLLMSGPSVPMKAGEYTLVVTGAAASTASARVEVVSSQGSVVHAGFTLSSTNEDDTGVLAWGSVFLDNRVADREVRVYVGGDDEVRLDAYEFIPVLDVSDFFEGYPFSQVGRFRDGSIVSDGREGFLVFGPYAPVDAGRYMLVVTGSASSPVSAWVDVVSGRGGLEHARFAVRPTADGARGVIASAFVHLDGDVADLEVRLFVGVHDRVRLDGYSLGRVYDTMDRALRVTHFGRPDVHSRVGQLSNGSLMSTGQEGFLAFGPYTTMSAGEYSLVVTGAALSTASAWIDVVSAHGDVEHARLDITSTKDGETGVLAAARIYLDADVSDLEVRVYVGADDDVRLDGYELVPIGGTTVPSPGH